jgi:DNA-binding MarR family transcriptional regulator
MARDSTRSEADGRVDGSGQPGSAVGLGPALRRAWLGYQARLDEAMAAAGFDDRKFPDGRVLRLCSDPAGTTISSIGRQLGITRQGAGKVAGRLRDRGYVSVVDSATSGREKSVTLTARGADYLQAQRKAARTIERQLVNELGATGFSVLYQALDVLGQGQEVRMSTYLQRSVTDPGDPPEGSSRGSPSSGSPELHR